VARVYLETSFVSACVTDRADAASVYRRDASLDWWRAQRPRHDLCVSDEVIAELAHPDFKRRDAALRWIDGLPVLPVNAEAAGLAAVLVRERVMPAPLAGDALHVAAATVHRMDYVLSWNVRHLANPNKVRHLAVICLRLGFAPPQIVTPDLLWETPDE
jgi:hypothetical protein